MPDKEDVDKIIRDLKDKFPDATITHVHITRSEPDCQHDFAGEEGQPADVCTKCGYSFIRYCHGLDFKF